VCLTRSKAGAIYALYLAKPEETVPPSQIRLSGTKLSLGAKIRMLGVKGKLKWRIEGDGFLVEIPESVRNKPPCEHAWVLEIK
jgi:alpha-L-fucosidase